MRATISFEIDLDQVEGTMGMLVAQEAHDLRAAADLLEDYITPQDNVLEKVTLALGLLQEASTQLQQYHQMLISFEKAKFETILPTTAAAPVAVQPPPVMERAGFGDFMDRMATEGESDDSVAEEG